MSTYNDNIYNDAIKQIGVEIGGVPYRIYRPNYLSSTNAETLVATRIARLDVQANRFQEPSFSGIDPYEVFSDIKIIRSGDVLIPVTAGKGPTVTMLTLGGQKASIGVLTDRICSVYDGGDDPIYTGMRFGWVGPSFPGSSLHDAVEDSLKIPKRKAIVYKRQGIGMNPSLKVGMEIYETNNDVADADGNSYKWKIQDILTKYNATILSLQEA